jgi:very-short-patch-repair endonuclease
MDNWQADFFYGATPDIFDKARSLRKNMTVAEKELWERLKGKKIKGYRFRPQHPINFYIADFYCHVARLVIEIDGEQHNLGENKTYDIDREKIMLSLGINTLRFKNQEVLNEIGKVISLIEASLP